MLTRRDTMLDERTVREVPPGQPARARKHAASVSRSLQLLAAGALIVIIGVTAQQLWRTRAAIIDNAVQQVTRLDMVFAEQTGRAVETVDLIVQNLAEYTPERIRENPIEAASLFRRRLAGVKQISALAVADPNGVVVGASTPDLLGVLPAAGMAALAQHRADPEGRARISAPVRDWDGRWMALVTRRLSTREGGFAGMTIAYLNLAYFENFYEAVDLNENGSILLHHQDGTVLARFPRADGIIGSSYADEPPFTTILAHKNAGSVIMPSPIDGKERILAIRALKMFPLAVSVSVGQDEILAGWWNEVWALSAAALSCGLALTATLLLLSQRARRTEMAQQRRTLGEVTRIASLDALTGLLNRTTLGARFDRLLAQAEGSPAQVALLFLDIDGFKPINDIQGHKAGDAVLRVLAERIALASVGADVARWGGDEFVIITAIPGAPREGTPPEALALATNILRAVSAPVDLGSQTIRVAATIGLAMYPQDGRTPEALVSAADAAMYDGKQSGGNTVRVYDPVLAGAVADALDLERDLRSALAAGALSISYQPIIEMPDERCVGFEALLRWDHPTRGVVSPATFIPVAEHSGLIGQLGRWVLHRACQDAAGWPDQAGLAVSVNVSIAQIMSGMLAQDVEAALAQSGLPAKRLHLELTESMVGSDHSRIVPVLRTLREMGVGIALDDFGTGFSSLNRLRTWPIDIVKIDQSFVQGMDTHGTAVIRATLLVAREYGLTVTVEGVENIAQWRELMSLGVQNFQGYLFSHPLASSAVVPWLEQASQPKLQRRRGWGRAKLEYSALLDVAGRA